MITTELNQNLLSPIDCFYRWERETPNNCFLKQPYGKEWKSITFKEAGLEARKMCSSLRDMGLQKGDHIGISSKNCYHWILADLAIMMGGFVSAPFYASLPKIQLKEVIEKSDIKALFIGKLDSWGDRADAIPEDLKVITFPHYEGNKKIDIGDQWDKLIENHKPSLDTTSPHLDDLWTILFTSGTTGTPKGVMHSHKAPAMIMRAEELTDWIGTGKIKNHKFLSFLPLNHVAERIAVEVTALRYGGCISFGESIDTFAANLQDTQPTTFFAVPRIWTKFYLGVTAKFPVKKLNILLKIPLVSGLIKTKIRKVLGLRDAKIVATGAAITPAFIKDFFKKIGIHLIEAYGMTEVCGSMTNGPDHKTPVDSVGAVIPFGAVKIDPDTNEILMKSPYMMLGYYKEPEKTAEVLIDGWMHSGDRGIMDKNGYLHVIGRVKDAFKTDKGKYIIPNPIEEVLTDNEYLEQICVVGLGCSQPIVLANLSDIGLSVSKELVIVSLEKQLEEVNRSQEAFSKVSTVIITIENWSEGNGLLTPTLKVRRGAIDDRFGSRYVEWHEMKETVVWED